MAGIVCTKKKKVDLWALSKNIRGGGGGGEFRMPRLKQYILDQNEEKGNHSLVDVFCNIVIHTENISACSITEKPNYLCVCS